MGVEVKRPKKDLFERFEDFKRGENYHFHELLEDAAAAPCRCAGPGEGVDGGAATPNP